MRLSDLYGNIKSSLMKLFYNMEDSTSEATGIQLVWIMAQNFLVMFMIMSAVGFTMSALGILTVHYDIYVFTGVFSAVWGMAGAGYALKRERNDIRFPTVFEAFLDKMGLSDGSSEIATFCHVLARGWSDHLFIPGVKHPKI